MGKLVRERRVVRVRCAEDLCVAHTGGVAILPEVPWFGGLRCHFACAGWKLRKAEERQNRQQLCGESDEQKCQMWRKTCGLRGLMCPSGRIRPEAGNTALTFGVISRSGVTA